jgi:hypothetical protein
LPSTARALEGRLVVQQLLDLALDHRRLFLDDQEVVVSPWAKASMRVGSSG